MSHKQCGSFQGENSDQLPYLLNLCPVEYIKMPIRLLDPDFLYKFTYLMANNADPDQLASSEASTLDLHCLKRQDLSGFSRTRVLR